MKFHWFYGKLCQVLLCFLQYRLDSNVTIVVVANVCSKNSVGMNNTLVREQFLLPVSNSFMECLSFFKN